MEVHGLAELQKALLALPRELTSKSGGPVLFALRAAAKPMHADAIEKAPEDTGRLRRAIKMQRHPNPKYLNEIVGIGVDLGRSRDDPNGAWYGWIVEFKARFLRRAFEANKQSSVDVFRSKLAASIVRIGKKIGDTNAQAMAKYK